MYIIDVKITRDFAITSSLTMNQRLIINLETTLDDTHENNNVLKKKKK